VTTIRGARRVRAVVKPPAAGPFGRILSRRTLLRSSLAGAVGAFELSGCEPGPQPATGQRFPDGFRWGAATSAYQIEGATNEGGRGVSIWDTFSQQRGKTRDGDTGELADDHYHRYAQDVDLMKSLGLQSYRFSIAWPRIIPTGTGAVNPQGMDFYKRLVEAVRAKGITPMATLFHWDLPQILQDRGGWENRDCAQWFADYASAVFAALGDVVPTFLTINEPKTVANVGYGVGYHAPGIRGKAPVAGHHLLLAHGLAVQAYRASGAKGRIGPALNLAPVYPSGDGADRAVAFTDGMENRLYLDPVLRGRYPDDLLQYLEPAGVRPEDLPIIGAPIDLLAVQYYNPVYVDALGNQVQVHPTSEATWQQIYPEGFYDILVRLKNDYAVKVPITITENGIATPDSVGDDGRVNDTGRIAFLTDHLRALQRAIAAGVKVESYHVWSLLDNFEWSEGFTQRWGIVYVDYVTQKRTPKASASWYQGVIAANAV
jgi:beta-glucosidase